MELPCIYARDKNGKLTTSNVNPPFTCIACQQPMVFQKTHKRAWWDGSPAKAATFDVQMQFVHVSPGCGEAWYRRTAITLTMGDPTSDP